MMKEPAGLMERLRAGRPSAADLEFVEHKLSTATGHSEIKVLNRLRARVLETMAGRSADKPPR
jgi:hypothetical protein